MKPATTPAGTLGGSLLSTMSPREIPPPDGLQLDPIGWSTLATAETDALLVGDELEIWRVVSSLWPSLPKPRFWCDGQHQRISLPTYCEGTLILRNVHELSPPDQAAVLDWCEAHHDRSRMIATAPRHLQTLVEGGGFDRRLHDRLKAVHLLLL